jgi:flagellin-like protein
MFNQQNKAQDRGQVGIGTLIVFIALVLVAAIAAGVLINTAGFLQSQAEATGEESTSQVSSGVDVVSSYGFDNDGTDGIEEIDLTVSKQAGSEPVNVTGLEIQVVGPDGTDLIVEDSTTGTGTTFTTTNIEGDAAGTLEEEGDRVEISFTLDSTASGQIEAGQSAELTITTPKGAQTFETLQASDPLENPEDL